jgi:hypothetical protein
MDDLDDFPTGRVFDQPRKGHENHAKRARKSFVFSSAGQACYGAAAALPLERARGWVRHCISAAHASALPFPV